MLHHWTCVVFVTASLAATCAAEGPAAELPGLGTFVETHCLACHATAARKGRLAIDELLTADVAVANISAEAVRRLLPRLEAGTIVTSGYLEDDAPGGDDFRHQQRLTDNGWAADVFRRKE